MGEMTTPRRRSVVRRFCVAAFVAGWLLAAAPVIAAQETAGEDQGSTPNAVNPSEPVPEPVLLVPGEAAPQVEVEGGPAAEQAGAPQMVNSRAGRRCA